jgi:hypothetical protein
MQKIRVTHKDGDMQVLESKEYIEFWEKVKAGEIG